MSAAAGQSLLFLSCDLVGSTRFKQQGKVWQSTFLSFYREFPQILGELTRLQDYAPGFSLWKPVGDELIFTSPVKSENDIYRAVRVWLTAMHDYEANVLDETTLLTKGGAFVATFPGPDSESSIPRDPLIETSDKGVVELNDEALASRTDEYLYDYFGPSIDTGFRIFAACSHRYFAVSVEVAWALAQCATDAGAKANFPIDDLRLLETREFKGVWDGRAYPLFALDRHHKDLVNVALAKIQNHKLEPVDVVDLCRECCAKEDWPSALYLPDSSHKEFLQVPEDSLASLRLNSMEGAESVPTGGAGGDLEADPPMGGPEGGKEHLSV